jgi:hypothetical protein
MFELIMHAFHAPHLQQMLGMGRAVMDDWDDLDDQNANGPDWYYSVKDRDGDTVCYEYTSIYTQQTDTQQWGCRGEFPGSQCERASPVPNGRAVCGDTAWGSDVARAGCGNWAQTGYGEHWRSAQPSWPGTHHRTM